MCTTQFQEISDHMTCHNVLMQLVCIEYAVWLFLLLIIVIDIFTSCIYNAHYMTASGANYSACVSDSRGSEISMIIVHFTRDGSHS